MDTKLIYSKYGGIKVNYQILSNFSEYMFHQMVLVSGEHFALLSMLVYIFLIFVGSVYMVSFFRQFDIDILVYINLKDFMVIPLKYRESMIFSVAGIILIVSLYTYNVSFSRLVEPKNGTIQTEVNHVPEVPQIISSWYDQPLYIKWPVHFLIFTVILYLYYRLIRAYGTKKARHIIDEDSRKKVRIKRHLTKHESEPVILLKATNLWVFCFIPKTQKIVIYPVSEISYILPEPSES